MVSLPAIKRILAYYLVLPLDVAADTHFANPPDVGASDYYVEDVVFHLDSNEKLQWMTDLDYYAMYLFQQSEEVAYAQGGSPIFTKSLGQPEEGGAIWNVSLDGQPFSLDDSNIYFLSLGQNGSLTGVSTSHYFNITDALNVTTASMPASSSTTSSTLLFSSSTSISTVSASTLATIPSSPITSSSSKPASTASSSALNTDAKIGLGVGLGIGVPIMFLLGALVWFLYRRPRRRAAAAVLQNQVDTPFAQLGLLDNGAQEFDMGKSDPKILQDGHTAQSELAGDGARAKSELPTDNNMLYGPSELSST